MGVPSFPNYAFDNDDLPLIEPIYDEADDAPDDEFYDAATEYILRGRIEIIEYTSEDVCQDTFNEYVDALQANPEFHTEIDRTVGLRIIARQLNSNRIVQIVEYFETYIVIATF